MAPTSFPDHILQAKINGENQVQDLEDVPSLRRFMVDLDSMLMNTEPKPDIEGQPARTPLQERIIKNIISNIQDDHAAHTLLLQASLRFVAARNGDDQAVLAAAQEMVSLAREPVLTNPAVYEREYQDACQCFHEIPGIEVLSSVQLLQRAPGLADPRLHSSIQIRQETRVLGALSPLPPPVRNPAPLAVFPEVADSVPYNPRPKGRGGRKPKPKRSDRGWHYLSDDDTPVKASASSQALTLESPSETGSKFDDEDSEYGTSLRRSTRGKYVYTNDGKRPESPEEFTPKKRPRNTRNGAPSSGKSRPSLERIPSFDGAASDPEEDSSCNPQNPDSLPEDQFLVFDPDATSENDNEIIDDNTYSRETAILNKPNESLLHFQFNTERAHPNRRLTYGYRVLGQQVPLQRHTPTNWSDEHHIKSLRAWRNDILNEKLGKRANKDVFLKSEAEVLTNIVKAELKNVGGAWSKLKWNGIAKALDRAHRDAGRQTADLELEPLRYSFQPKNKGKTSRTNVLNCGLLGIERHYPKRVDKDMDLEAAFKSFVDPRKKKIWRDAMEVDRKGAPGYVPEPVDMNAAANGRNRGGYFQDDYGYQNSRPYQPQPYHDNGHMYADPYFQHNGRPQSPWDPHTPYHSNSSSNNFRSPVTESPVHRRPNGIPISNSQRDRDNRSASPPRHGRPMSRIRSPLEYYNDERYMSSRPPTRRGPSSGSFEPPRFDERHTFGPSGRSLPRPAHVQDLRPQMGDRYTSSRSTPSHGSRRDPVTLEQSQEDDQAALLRMQREEEVADRQFEELKKKIPPRSGNDREIADSTRQSEEIESSVEPAPSNGQDTELAAKNRVRKLRKQKEMREAELKARVEMKHGPGASSETQEAVPQNEKIDNEATEVSQKDDKELVVNNVQNGELRQAAEAERTPKARDETPSVVEISD